MQNGYSLLEILIALCLLAVGFLALAQGQIAAVQTEQESFYLALATEQANSMAALLRINQGLAVMNGLIEQWKQSNQKLLPEGESTIQVMGESYNVRLSWQGKHKTTTTQNLSQVELMVN